jgi:hypothetical protein
MLLGEMTLAQDDHFYTLARRPGIESGLVVREAPVDLASALPRALPEGGSVTGPVLVKEASTLRAELEDGTLLPLSLDGARSADEVVLPAGGSHRVTIQAPSDGGPRVFSLVGTPQRERSGLVALPADLAPKRPDLPVLLEAQPRHFDLAATESRTFLMKAADAALYRVETTGLLATSGNLRTRTVTSLARATSGGSGRNFLVQQYLRSGDYHVTVSALGKSAGHLGLSLRRAAVREGGDLEDVVQANATLPGGEAIAFDLEVTERSTWHLGAVALGRTLRCRLEEDGGWPIETPGGAADITRELEPGRYRLIVLPEATTVRVAALASRIADPVKREGHGPFDLPFDEVITHQWTEPAPHQPGAAERVPDRWNIVMTGTSEVSIALGNGMEGRLVPARDPEQGLPAIVRPSRPWTGELHGGRSYVLEVTSPRRDNRRIYTVSAHPKKLLPGMTRDIHAPAEVELASDGSATTPGASLELVASGMSDVRARLTDDAGRTLAASDDAPDDWNFRFDGVPAAAARLLVEPVGAERATTRVAFRARAGVMPSEALAVPLDLTLDLPGGQPETLRFDAPPSRGLLIVSVSAREEMSVEASVEDAEARSGWTLVDRDAGRKATVVVPWLGAREGRPVLVSLRSSRGGRARPRVTAAIVEPATVDPAGGDLILPRVSGGSVNGGGDVFAATLGRHHAMLLRVGLPHGTALRLVRAHPWRVTPPAFRVEGDMLALDSDFDSWLVATSSGATSSESASRSLRVAADRIILRPGAPAANLRLGPETIGCEVEPPPPGTLRLVIVESAGARPLVGMELNHPDAAIPGTTWRSGAAAAFKDGQTSRAWMRLAGGESSAPSPARAFAVDLPFEVRKPPGPLWSGVADPSIAWQIPALPGVMRLTLDAGTFAVLTDGFFVRSVHGSTTEAIDETFQPHDSSQLHVVRLDGSSGRHAVQVLAGAVPATAPGMTPLHLDESRPLEFLPAHAGRTRVSVQATRAASLRVMGAEAAWLVRGALDVSAVDDEAALAAAESATLVIEHGLAPVAAWLEADSTSAWGSARPEAAPVQISAPASVALDGVSTTLRVESAEPALLSLRTTHPVVARVRRAGGMQPEARAWPLGARLDAWIPSGATEVDLRGFASAGLGGSATVSLSPAVELREGVGDSGFLPAGSARAFTFGLMRSVKVGLGMRSTSDDIDVNLFDAGGTLLGSGIVQMPELQPGRYVVVVSAPAAADPVAVRPVLLGLDEPGLGPAPDIVRRYVLGEEAPPENAAPLPPDWRRWLGVPPTGGAASEGCCTDAESSGETYSEEGE